MGRGVAWLGTGMHQSLQEASSFIETIERRPALKVAYPGEMAFRVGCIDVDALARSAEAMRKNAGR